MMCQTLRCCESLFRPAVRPCVLITGARSSAGDLGDGVPVDVFSAAEASAFLTGRTGLDDGSGARSRPYWGTWSCRWLWLRR